MRSTVVIPKYPWVMALFGFILACAGSWAHTLYTSPVSLPVNPRLAGIALMVLGGALALLGIYKARKFKYKRIKTTALVFLGLALVVILATAFYFYGAYSTRDFKVSSGGELLAGTLFLPRGPGPHPTAVFVHGTTDRLHRQGLVYADYLARRGVGVFVYDKRGAGASSGSREFEVPLNVLAEDALACYRYLQSTGQIDSSEMGFIGESQGGVVGEMAALEAGDCSFLICLSSPGMSLGEQMMHYHRDALRESGQPEKAVNWADDLRKRIWATWPDYEDYSELYTELNSAREYDWYSAAGLPTVLMQPSQQRGDGGSPYQWMNPDLNHDPLVVLGQLDCPMLFIYGGKDNIVPVKESQRRLEAVLGGNGVDYTIEVFDDADHSLYVTGEEEKMMPKLAPGLLDAIGEWAETHIR